MKTTDQPFKTARDRSHVPTIKEGLAKIETWALPADGKPMLAVVHQCALCEDTGRYTGYVEAPDGTRRLQGDGPCPRCCSRGIVEMQRDNQARIDRLFGDAGIDQRWLSAKLADFGPTTRESIQARISLASGAFLTGNVGTGKTHLMIAALRSRLDLGESALYMTVPNLLLRIKASFDRDGAGGASEAALIEEAVGVRWLGLDDLGVEKLTAWGRSVLYQVIDSRYARTAPIICTSNLTLEQLASEDLLGPRIVSRLRQICGDPIELGGTDQRRMAA